MTVASRPSGVLSLGRALSKLGVCSRSEASLRIQSGRVTVNGQSVTDPRAPVDPSRDRIDVDSLPATAGAERLVVAFHKPVGYITTRTDPSGRPTVYDLLDDVPSWVFPVGRLDRDTSGLLVLTNDSILGERLRNPDSHVEKTYHVRTRGLPAPEAIQALRDGLQIGDSEPTRPARVRVLGMRRDGEAWLEMVLTEGRNRQVRRMCSAVGHDVVSLARIRIGAFALGSLDLGAWRRLGPAEVRALVVDTEN